MTPLEIAEASIRATLGLSATPSDWTYDERLAYNNALSTYVQRNSTSFSPEELAIAQRQSAENPTALDNTGFLSDLSSFGGAIADEAVSAGNSIAGVGKGVLSTFDMAKWLIPTVAILVVGILLFGLYKKQTA